MSSSHPSYSYETSYLLDERFPTILKTPCRDYGLGDPYGVTHKTKQANKGSPSWMDFQNLCPFCILPGASRTIFRCPMSYLNLVQQPCCKRKVGFRLTSSGSWPQATSPSEWEEENRYTPNLTRCNLRFQDHIGNFPSYPILTRVNFILRSYPLEYSTGLTSVDQVGLWVWERAGPISTYRGG